MTYLLAADNSALWAGFAVGCVVTLAGLGLLFFDRATEGDLTLDLPFGLGGITGANLALTALLVGVIGTGLSVWQLNKQTNSGPSTEQATVGAVSAIDSAPPFPARRAGEPKGLEYLRWIQAFFDDAQVNINLGRQQMIAQGDYFATIRRADRVRGTARDDIGNLADDTTALLRVARVLPHASIAQVEEFAYGPVLARLPGSSTPKQLVSLGAPVRVSEPVVLIPREEKAAHDGIEREQKLASRSTVSRAERRLRLEDVIQLAEGFLLDHSKGFFAPDALFDKGSAQRQLGDRVRACGTFAAFIDRYPFHTSAKGAREHIDQLRCG